MSAALGAVVGLGVATGSIVAFRRLPMNRRLTLAQRVGPYIRPSNAPIADPLAITPFASLQSIFRPTLKALATSIQRHLGGEQRLVQRLGQEGRNRSPIDHRISQLCWAATGFAVGLVLAIWQAVAGQSISPVVAAIFASLCAVGGGLLCDQQLGARIKRRRERMAMELPSIAELLAFSVSAGEGAVPALDRIAHTCHGELSREFRSMLAETRTGTPLPQALSSLATRLELPPLNRLVDGVVTAVERGTPLADVLRAQAVDSRDESLRELLAIAGRKEVLMLIPVVFLLLPVTVVVAVFPGFYGIDIAA